MIRANGDIACEVCDATTQSGKWNQIRAQNEGWYSRKDGRHYCPKHRPNYAPSMKGKGTNGSEAPGR